MSYVKMGKNMKSWMSDATRRKGATGHNLEILREANEARDKLKNITVVTYFLLKEYKMDALQSMFASAQKQRDLCSAVILDLKKFKLDDEWYPVIKRDLSSIERRYLWVLEMVKENVRLTKLQPFFDAYGFDSLFAIRQGDKKETEEAVADLKKKISTWNKKHEAEVSAYEKAIKDEVEKIEARRQKIKDDERKEREARRMRRKQVNDELKEMRKNEIEHRKEIRKENRVYEYWCK